MVPSVRLHLVTSTKYCTLVHSSVPCRDTSVIPLCTCVVWTGSPIHRWRKGLAVGFGEGGWGVGMCSSGKSKDRIQGHLYPLDISIQRQSHWSRGQAVDRWHWTLWKTEILIWIATGPYQFQIWEANWKHSSTSDDLNMIKHNLGCLIFRRSEGGDQHRTAIK